MTDFLEKIRPHTPTLALVMTWLGIAIVYFRRRFQWQRKQFLNQVNFSLNYVVNDSLAMRTLLETGAQSVWLNEYGVRKVFAAAAKTTLGDPFIRLDDQTDQDFINRAVLNMMSARFAECFLANALGLPAQLGRFCFAITCERYEEIRTVKIRVLIIEEQLLNQLFGPDRLAEKLQTTQQVLRARLNTLKCMYELYVKEKGSDRPVLGHVEMGLHP
jgi:hypothetical protein